MPKVLVSTVINAPIERVWRTVSDFNGLPAWMPGMKDSIIEDGKPPNAVGAVRRLGMAGTKDVLRERLEVFDTEELPHHLFGAGRPAAGEKDPHQLHLRPITDSYGTLGEWSTAIRNRARQGRRRRAVHGARLQRRLSRAKTTSRRLITWELSDQFARRQIE